MADSLTRLTEVADSLTRLTEVPDSLGRLTVVTDSQSLLTVVADSLSQVPASAVAPGTTCGCGPHSSSKPHDTGAGLGGRAGHDLWVWPTFKLEAP